MPNDELLRKSLLKIKEQMEEELSSQTRTDGLNAAIADEYREALERLGRIIPKVSCVLDLYYLGEEDFLFALDCLENYAGVFIVDGRGEERLSETMAEYRQLENILSEFYDDEEEDDGDDCNDEEYDDDDDGGSFEDDGSPDGASS